ncbi:hypothetical protein GF340_02685, partial [Candidatus Peregrinibacteria bacterium]|nr:hypothetical protein [Candidatus Peregrinibacteria bacterium]
MQCFNCKINEVFVKNMISLSGKVVKGHHLGKEIGYPTINLEGDFQIEGGVYASIVYVGDEKYSGALYYGPNKLAGDERFTLEVYLLDFKGNLYDETVKIDVY